MHPIEPFYPNETPNERYEEIATALVSRQVVLDIPALLLDMQEPLEIAFKWYVFFIAPPPVVTRHLHDYTYKNNLPSTAQFGFDFRLARIGSRTS